MLLTKDTFDKLYSKYFATNRLIALKITNRCPTECAHCRECATASDESVMSQEVIDTIIKQIVDDGDPEGWVMCLQGGESILYPELCKYTVAECKRYGILSNLYSSGWWWKELPEYKKLIVDIDPDLLTISVNDWTVEKLGGPEYADAIGDAFAGEDTRAGLIYSECYLDRPKWSRRLKNKTCTFPYQIAPVGRAKDLEGKYDLERWITRDTCTLSGFEIETDGRIFSNCCAATAGCYFGGTVFDLNVAKLIETKCHHRCKGYGGNFFD